MASTPDASAKPTRLYFKTYLRMIQNSVGTELFRNFYIQTPASGVVDALDDGSNSCAFYVSSILTLLKRLSGVHGTVAATVQDLRQSGWQEVAEPSRRPGDVIVWAAIELEGAMYEHIGFYAGNNRAVSTSWTRKRVIEHDVYFGGLKRPVKHVFRQLNWA